MGGWKKEENKKEYSLPNRWPAVWLSVHGSLTCCQKMRKMGERCANPEAPPRRRPNSVTYPHRFSFPTLKYWSMWVGVYKVFSYTFFLLSFSLFVNNLLFLNRRQRHRSSFCMWLCACVVSSALFFLVDLTSFFFFLCRLFIVHARFLAISLIFLYAYPSF